MRTHSIILLLTILGYVSAISQCNPPASSDCASAPVLCALNELDGLSCTTLSTSNPTGPNPLCSGEGMPQNTQWWSFLGNGQHNEITISIDLANCSLERGIQAGIIRNCGGYVLDCVADCSSNSVTLSFNTEGCVTYNLWIDGCQGDICDFDIQILNGIAPWFPSPLLPPMEIGKNCVGSTVEICLEDMFPCEHPYIDWTQDGVALPGFKNQNCIEIGPIDEDGPIEICAILSIGKAPNLCDQKTTCLVVTLDPIPTVDEGDIFVCYEEHQGNGYTWPRDTLIYDSCIDPPCRVTRQDPNNCLVNYTARIHLLEPRGVKTIYQVVCDPDDLPYRTEDGQLFFDNACDEEITWPDQDYYDCDTSYLFNLEIIDPVVRLTQSCPQCSDSVRVFSEVIYEDKCTFGEVSFISLWLNEEGDTIGVGDSILTPYKGKVSMELLVNHINDFTGEQFSCTLNDTSWHIELLNEALTIRGDSGICDVDTSFFSLPDVYSKGCTIEWTIEEVNGRIITPSPKDSSNIEVFWPESNTKNGQICAQLLNGCDSIVKTCLTLKGCIITSTLSSLDNATHLYPNPAYDRLYIDGIDPDEMAIRMMDILGNEISIQPKQDIGGAVSINIGNTPPGIYLILISRGDETAVKKVMVGR